MGYGGSAGPSSVGVGYSNGGNVGYVGNAGYAGQAASGTGHGGFAPMLPSPSTACPHAALLLPHIPLPYPDVGNGYCQGQGYTPTLRPMSAPPGSFYGPFLPPFPPSEGGGQECPPPPPMQIFLRFRR